MGQLESLGHVITSRWLTQLDENGDEWARNDLADVDAADVLLAMNPVDWERGGTGGRHVELGYAIAREKQVVLWGRRSNIFHHLSSVRVIERLEDL